MSDHFIQEVIEAETITITTDHEASSYGVPVCLIDGELQDDVDGLRACMAALGWKQADLAERTGKTLPAVGSYLYNRRPVPAEVWLVLRDALREK